MADPVRKDMPLHEYGELLITISRMKEELKMVNSDIAAHYHITEQRVQKLYIKSKIMRDRLRNNDLYKVIYEHCKNMSYICVHQMYQTLIRRGYDCVRVLQEMDDNQLAQVRGLGKVYVGVLIDIKNSLYDTLL